MESAYQAGITICEEPEERNGLVCSDLQGQCAWNIVIEEKGGIRSAGKQGSDHKELCRVG